MNICEQYKNRFSDYIDGELRTQEAADFRTHLDECPECAEDLKSFEDAHEALLTLAVPVTSRPVLPALKARIRQEEQAKQRRRWLWVPAPALAAAVLVVLFVSGKIADQPVQPTASNPGVTAQTPEALSIEPEIVASLPEAAVQPMPEQEPVSSSDQPETAPQLVASQPVPEPAPRETRRSTTVTSRTTPAPSVPAPSVRETPAVVVDDTPKIMVVAYRPPANYSAQVQDPVTGRNITRVSVNSTYAADGTVENAQVILHFPPSVKAEDNGKEDNRPTNPGDSRARSIWGADAV